KNKATDVLSFGTRDIREVGFPESAQEKDFLGEIVICPKFVETKIKIEGYLYLGEVQGGTQPQARRTLKYSEQRGAGSNEEIHPIQRSYTRLFVHSLLHLLGYDHEKSEKQARKMEELESKILGFRLY
ncbi:MAG: rRNA maturation RNase YbeY, partial [Candidatus Staskawiczbacteria bacterium]|nr:rRNA maturation RNase YbeY [Candidatus Staskawiczbacteria bacterium]